uniref:Uncharacterized protein n=1 Tax=Plectus sambesii TaxID=2011161 RepID=A0A914VZL8_9BILA
MGGAQTRLSDASSNHSGRKLVGSAPHSRQDFLHHHDNDVFDGADGAILYPTVELSFLWLYGAIPQCEPHLRFLPTACVIGDGNLNAPCRGLSDLLAAPHQLGAWHIGVGRRAPCKRVGGCRGACSVAVAYLRICSTLTARLSSRAGGARGPGRRASAAELQLVAVSVCLCGSAGDAVMDAVVLRRYVRLTDGRTTMRHDEWLLTNCASAVTLALLRQLSRAKSAATVVELLRAIAANCPPLSPPEPSDAHNGASAAPLPFSSIVRARKDRTRKAGRALSSGDCFCVDLRGDVFVGASSRDWSSLLLRSTRPDLASRLRQIVLLALRVTASIADCRFG